MGAHPAAIAVVDGEVSFATNDPNCSLREVLLSRAVIDEDGWNEAIKAKDVDLGVALAAQSRASGGDLRAVVHEHILATVHELRDLDDGRFRFVLGARHSMGQDYAYPVGRLFDDVVTRCEAWRSIGDVVPGTDVVARLNDTAPPGEHIVCVAATDWPVLVALDGQRPLGELVAATGMAPFAICQAAHRLVIAGLATVVHDGTA
jgi:hypothetical protein